MALSKLRQEAQKEREREEARKKQNAQQNTQRQTSQSAAGSSGVSKLRQEAAKERAQNPDVYKWKAPAQDFKPNFVIPQASRNNAETSKTTRTATGGGAQSGGPDGERRAAAGMGTRTSTTVQSEIDSLKKYRNVLLTERSRAMENTDAPADGGKLRDLTEQIRTISDRMNALDDEKNRLSDIERQALLDSGEIEDSDWWDIVVKSLNSGVKSLNSGVAQFNNAFASTADFLLPTDFLGEYDPASRFSDWTQKKYEQAEQERQETLIGRGKAANIASELVAATVSTIPNTILAVLSRGSSVAAQGGAELTAGAVSPGITEMVNNAVRQMAKNPMYWASFIQTLGSDYDEAKANGATDAEAAVTAILSSSVNAAIEIGGGLETLPKNVTSGSTSDILNIVRSMGEEGMEEVEQRLVSGATQKAVYDRDKPVYSSTDENAIVNPAGMARDFLMGAGVAGILGGGQVVGVKALNAYYDTKTKAAQAVQDAKAKAAQAAAQAQERRTQAQQAAWEKANAHFEVPEDVADVPYTHVERNGEPVDNSANTVHDDIMEAGRAETENTPAAERTATEADETRTSEEVIPSEEKPATTARSAERNDMLPVPAREHDTRGAAVNMLARTAQEAKMGENGVRAIGEWYDETENPQIAPYFGAFAAYYNGGRNGLDYDAIHSGQASAVTEVVRRAAYNAGRMDAIQDATKSAPEPVANPAQRGYTEGVKTGESAKTPKYKTIRTKKSDWTETDITWYAPHQKSPIAYSTAAVRDFIGAMVDDNQTATVRELQAKIKYDQDAKKVLQQYIDAGYGDDTAMDYFGDDAGTGKPAAAAAETQQKPKSAAETQQNGESQTAWHVPLNTDKELDAVLNLGTGTAGGERRVREFYNNNHGVSVKEATDFLKKEFGIGGRSHKLTDGTSGFADWDAKGIRLWVTPDGDEHTFTWAQVDARYRAIYGVESTVDQKSLTDGELYALTEYKSSESYKINAALRDGDELDERQKSFVEDMDSGLKKLPVHRGIVYRNIGFDDFGGKEARDEFVKSHVEGVPVIYSAYTSASTKVDGYIVEDEFVVHMQIVSENGRNLEGIGNNFESEILFERGSFFVPQRVEYASDGTPTIYLTEVTESERTGEKGAGGSLRGDHRGQPKASSDSQDSEVRDVPAIHSVQSDVQEVSERDTRGHSERKGSVPDVQTEVKRASSPQQQIADEVRKYIENGKSFSAAKLFEIADQAYGGTMAEGTYTVKDAYDGMELAVNQYLMQSDVVKNGNGDAKAAKATLDKMVELLSKLPTQTKRTEEMEQYQQFSTPPNIAYLAAWSANVTASDVVLEPSAGIGGLALWPKAWGATVYANELSTRRLAFLNQLGLDGTFNLNAEQIDNLLPDSIKPSVVIMNPPFSSAAGRMTKNDTANAKRHIEQALDRLEDGGRLVAILGNGMADDAKGFKTWWNGLRKEYNVRANVQIDGKNYRKYGTTFNVQLVVIDKTGPTTAATLTDTVTDLSKIPDMMEGIRNDRTGIETDHEQLPGRVLGQGPDTGALADGGEGSERGVRSGRNDDGRGADGGAVQKPRNRRNGGGLSQQEKTGKGVPGVQERAGGKPDGGKGSGSDGNGADKLQLDRTDPVSETAQSKEAAENPDSVYAAYSPRKAKIKGAHKHPAKLVESAAMAAVEPPDPTYTPQLSNEIVTKGLLSDAQLENVVYAGQAHSQTLPDGRRKGYFIGDGTGVGKGRQLAGIIMDNWNQGRKRAIWISEKAGLVNDARRDWTDLGGNKDDILDFSKFKLGQEISAENGVMFSTYDTLKTQKDGKSRLDDLKRWLGPDFDGVICFDEAHNMANSAGKQGKRGRTKPSAKALAGIELQRAFPQARVIYASATGATDIGEYAYLERLGLWGKGTAFNNAEDFISKISAGGLAAMELVARDMKSMGVYMARSISYDDVRYDTLQHELTPMQTEIYNTMSRAWQTVFQHMNEALEVTGANKNGQARSAAIGMFYTTQQRFYNQIITSMSMPSVIADMRKELDAGRSCILQIVNTNAAQADRAIADAEKNGLSLDDLDLTPSETLTEMVKKAFPVQEYEKYTDENGNIRSRPVLDNEGNPVLSKKAIRMRDQLVEDLQNMKVPDGPLEMLFDAFGVDNVAEVTGRTRRVVEKLDDSGHMRRVVEKRSSKAGVADAQMFQDGKKRILVFSDAGGTGRSYHADKRAKNQQQRVHYLLQPGWSASKATQGFGRSHRSNQASAPIFRLVTTNVMGQKRFTSTIARRLDQLGALTKGQRQAGSGIFGEKDNLEGPIAQDALQEYYKTLSKETLTKLGLYEKIYDGSGKFLDGSPDLRDIGKFLNRILSLEVDEQNDVFQGFYDTFDRMMDVAIQNGTVDMGLENYRADKIEVMDEKVVRQDESGADTKYVQMKTYRKTELEKYADLADWHQNYQGLVRMEDGSVRAVYEISSKTNPRTGEVQRRFKLESPAKGNASTYVEETLKNKTKAIPKGEWKSAWEAEMEKAPEYNEGILHLLTGTLLPIWDKLPSNNTRVMRVISTDGRQYLGRVIRADQIDGVLRGLGANRTMQTYTPQQVNDLVLKQGKEVQLRDNRWKISRRRVSGEWRMEVSGQNIWYIQRQYPGIITERINYEYRYFIPTGEKGTSILADILKNNPVIDVREQTQAGDVDQMIGVRAADHSDEWTAQRVGDTDKTPKRLSEIIEQIRHDFGLNITTGHIRGSDTRGQYNRRDHGIRSRIANDLPTIAHELGHHFDEIFGLQDGITEDMRQELLDKLDPDLAKRYSKKKLLGEGIAEYVRKFLQNREVAAIDYPQFHDYFMKQFTGKDLALIEQLADEINAYYSMDADTATSSIRLREEGAPDARTFGEKIRDKMSVLYQAWVDSNEGIKRFDRATGSNTYIMASNAAYSDAMAGAIITGDLTDANGNYVAPGLKTALHGLNMQDEAEYRLFGEYLVVKHGPERLNEGMRIFADDRKNSTQWMNARQAELEAQYPQFAEISDRLYQFQKDFLATWGVATGLVSQESADEWADRWAYYVPFNRAVSEDKRGGGAKRGFANQNSTIKKARGSGLEIIHPVDNIINNIVRMVNAGVRNNVMRAITDAAQTMGADAAFLEQVPAPLTRTAFSMAGVKQDLTAMLEESSLTDIDKAQAQNIVGTLDNILYQYGRGKAHGDTITVLKGGKPEFWKINDPQLLDSLTSMSQPQMHGILDAYGRISRFITSNITGSNVIWSIFSNLPRDLGTFFTYSKNKNIAKMAAGVGSAYLNKAKGDNASPLYKEYLAMGGGNESMYSADRDLAKKARKKLEGKKINLNPLDWITFVSDMVESGPRFATYKLLREAGMTPQEAFFEATDITVNFRRGGTWARQVNKVAPFFNANVQGLDKFFRWISGEEASRLGKDRKKLVRTRAMQYLVASIVLAAIQALHIMAGDDEDKEKAYAQLSSFTKNSYWNFFMGDGKFFAVPKPREIAVLSSFFERCIELYIADNEHAFDEFYVYATDNFFPAFASDLLQLPVNGPKETMGSVIGNFGLLGAFGYISANRDFLGRPIVSSGLQNLEPKDQYTERTSKLAYWMGQAFDESPAMIDYFFEQTLGGWWKYQKVIFPVGEDARDLSLGIRNSYVKDSQYSTDLVNWMYDQASASQSAKNSDPSNMEKAITARMDNNMTSFYSRYYSQAKKVRETDRSRNVRQTVLDMIREYQKASDHGELTAAQEAVYAVCEKAGSTEYLPSVMQVSIKDGSDRTHELSAIQYVEYQTDYNRLYWEYVEDKLGGANTQAQKVAVLKAAKDVAREEATNRTLARIGAPKTYFAEKYAGLDAEDVVTFKAQLDLADDDDGSVQQAEFVDIILNMGLDDDEIYTLYFSKYDSETAYEAREVGIPADVYFPAKTEMANIKADKDENGKSISGSRRKKIEAYLNTVAQDYKQYLWLLGTEYESIFKDPDYIRFFGRK